MASDTGINRTAYGKPAYWNGEEWFPLSNVRRDPENGKMIWDTPSDWQPCWMTGPTGKVFGYFVRMVESNLSY